MCVKFSLIHFCHIGDVRNLFCVFNGRAVVSAKFGIAESSLGVADDIA